MLPHKAGHACRACPGEIRQAPGQAPFATVPEGCRKREDAGRKHPDETERRPGEAIQKIPAETGWNMRPEGACSRILQRA